MSFAAHVDLPRPVALGVAGATITGAAAVTGLLVAVRPTMALVALTGVTGIIAFASLGVPWHRVAIAACVTLAVIPIIGFPAIAGFVLHPAVAVATVLGFAAVLGYWPAIKPSSVTALDAVTGLMLMGLALSVLMGPTTIGGFIYNASLGLGAYLLGRALVVRGRARDALVGLALLGAAAAPFVAIEMISSNPFPRFFSYSVYETLGQDVTRLGQSRAQGSMGSPVPFSIVLATAAVAAFVLAASSRTFRARLGWGVIAAAVVVAQAAALSRSGWLVLGVSAVLLTGLRGSEFVRGRALPALLLVILVGGFAATSGPVRALFSGGGTSEQRQQIQASTEYRDELLSTALRPGTIQPFGRADKFDTSTGTGSIDNAFVWIGYTFGWTTLAGFVLLLPFSVRAMWRARRDLEQSAIAVLSVATLIALWSVALIGQQAVVFWLVVGATAGTEAGRRHLARTRPQSVAPKVAPNPPVTAS